MEKSDGERKSTIENSRKGLRGKRMYMNFNTLVA